MKKSKKAKNPPSPKASTDRAVEPTNDDIAIRAYVIWEQEGRPAGREVEHWLAAEAQLRQARGHGTPPE